MKATKAQLREHNIFNPHDLAKVGQDSPQVFVFYSPTTTGLAARYAQWEVARIGFKTDPNEDYGRKVFMVSSRVNKEPALQEALAWAENKYGASIFNGWERSPFGSYHAAGTLKRAMELTP